MCKLRVEKVPESVDLIKGGLIGGNESYECASIERTFGSCGPDGNLYEYEANWLKRVKNQQEGTFWWLVLFLWYVVVWLICCAIVSEILYFL